MKTRVTDECEKFFRPEFLNRLDDLIVFRHLTKDNLGQIVELELNKVRGRLKEKGFELVLTNDARDLIIKRGSDLDFGARPLRRAIESNIENPLAEELLKGEFKDFNQIVVDVKEVGGRKQLYFTGKNAEVSNSESGSESDTEQTTESGSEQKAEPTEE